MGWLQLAAPCAHCGKVIPGVREADFERKDAEWCTRCQQPVPGTGKPPRLDWTSFVAGDDVVCPHCGQRNYPILPD